MNTKSLILIIVILVVLGGVLYFRNSQSSQTSPVTPPTTTTTTAPTNAQPSMEEPTMGETTPSDTMMKEGSTSDSEEQMEMQNGTQEESTTQGEVKEFNLEAGSFYFTPNKITVNQGDTVKVTIHNVGGTHDWVIDEFNARTDVTQTGDTASTTFVADKAGTFEFYCSIDSHRAKGMVGTLTVNAQ